ncbi:hypothetical protein SAMN05421721_12331 [Ectothiorhodospira mobilis]|uniref:LppC lipoprotein n=1 Tax=Ectothiorhodospira mobilis TaxID=195064 RepID=A0A1I4SWR1_ECTMO|nr:penicillin-binding protein activator [Ectothiorhodospira mobilis]SFM68847.1 hypothetical protein SAMN05421721_12331 [Ectothiorhodospira mobilis]
MFIALLLLILWGAPPALAAPQEDVDPALEAAGRALARDAPLQALRHLPLDTAALPPAQRARTLSLRARAELRLGRILDAVSTWNTLWQEIPGYRRQVEAEMHRHLDALPRKILEVALEFAGDPETRRWLLWVLAEGQRPRAVMPSPSQPSPLAPRPGPGPVWGTRPQEVAVLLPLSGRYRSLGQAVRNGIEAARDDLGPHRAPRLRFLDTGGSPQRALEQYRAAMQEGAQAVLGPLLRPCVQAFAQQGQLPLPMVALNRADTAPPYPEALLQLGLPPEGEADQVARQAFAASHRGAFVLVPDTPLGRRLEAAFTTRFRALGGRIVSSQRYDEDRTDFQHLLRRGLGHGTDVLFLGADAAAARMIRPQLRYVRPEHPPVLATSRIRPRSPDPQRDRDLDGIRFTDIPALAGRRSPPAAIGRSPWPRLTALGMDALALILHPGAGTGETILQGQAGHWSPGPHGRLDPRFTWARFHAGQAVPTVTPGTR